jgi:hypothetical protein
MLDTPLMLVELSVVEQRYQAVSLVIHDGESVVDVARRFGVSRSGLSEAGGTSVPGRPSHLPAKLPRVGKLAAGRSRRAGPPHFGTCRTRPLRR